MNFKQFFNLLKLQRLFSGIYVTCTALSTALTMTLFLVIYIMVGPVYPEQERSRMAVVQRVRYVNKVGGTIVSEVSASLADSLRAMPEVEKLTAICSRRPETVADANGKNFSCPAKWVDDAFWQVYNFRFIHGRPFTAEEWKAQSPVCVISESLARRVFGRTDVAGEMMAVGGKNIYQPDQSNRHRRVVGVVEDVSKAMPLTYAWLWLPDIDVSERVNPEMKYLGRYTLVMTLREDKTVEQLQQRVVRFEERANQEAEANGFAYRLNLHDNLRPHWQSCFVSELAEDWHPMLRKILGLLLAFLLIPAMNMSSMVTSRISARISELGIRRAYGAGRATLLWQLLQENFLLTLIGSLLGLAISWLIVTLGADWLPFIFNQEAHFFGERSAVHLHADMLISGWVMAAVLTATLVLNLISVLAPALWMLHRPVTEEINHKR